MGENIDDLIKNVREDFNNGALDVATGVCFGILGGALLATSPELDTSTTSAVCYTVLKFGSLLAAPVFVFYGFHKIEKAFNVMYNCVTRSYEEENHQ